MSPSNEFDVLIIGSGLSGINAAYRIQEGLPNLSYVVLEGKDIIGGTWSLFKYPGFRSDSDLYTFGYPFEPWHEETAIVDGDAIQAYLQRVATKYGIDQNTKLNHQVVSFDWSSSEQRWTVEVVVNGTQRKTLYSRFVISGAGYYDYKEARRSEISGIENFTGTVVHPQFWPSDLDYTDKKVVILGSGATAATILPTMSKTASHVTLLQRSPGYYLIVPRKESPPLLAKYWTKAWIYAFQRLRIQVLSFIFFHLCHYFPQAGRSVLLGNVRQQLPPDVDMSHFTPSYAPFNQRLLMDPDGEFFAALRSKKASIETDRISSITDRTIRLESGAEIKDVDILVTATGLKVNFLQSLSISIDGGEPIDIASKFVWRGACLQDVPNLAFCFGYINNVWTLGCDATCHLMVRLIKRTLSPLPSSSSISSSSSTTAGSTITTHQSFTPRMSPEEKSSLQEVPMFATTSSGYITEAVEQGIVPRTANRQPWKPRWHYLFDWYFAKYGGVQGLEFSSGPSHRVSGGCGGGGSVTDDMNDVKNR